MKKELHPKYQTATVECACGNSFETRSTEGPVIKVELCSACHPFFTGKQKFVDTAGRVDKFRARIEAAESKKKAKTQNAKTEAAKEESKLDNKEVLKDIKAQITEKPPITVTQEESSDVEVAAAEELKISESKETEKENQ